jgi:uncharacterized protein (TIGR03083 family)
MHDHDAAAFVTTLLATSPDAPTRCAGWTAHELTAHLAAGAAEEADLIEARLAGAPSRATAAFETREAPFRVLDATALRDALFAQSLRLAAAISRLGDATVDFTGRPMTADEFAMHTRSECALHRWDLVGRDDIGWASLAQPALTRHAVAVLSSMHVLSESFSSRLRGTASARAVIRSLPHDDLVIEVCAGEVTATLVTPADVPVTLECEPAQRLLALWGRCDPSSTLRRSGTGAARELADGLLRTPPR